MHFTRFSIWSIRTPFSYIWTPLLPTLFPIIARTHHALLLDMVYTPSGGALSHMSIAYLYPFMINRFSAGNHKMGTVANSENTDKIRVRTFARTKSIFKKRYNIFWKL